MVDADAFASLAILNRNWYKAAQNRELYAHHLSRCPSYALSNTVITGPFRKFDLYRLKTKFAAEVRRNLFQAYLQPRQTLINLISVNASSSAALPGAEAFRFSFSPNGQTILALSSSRIYVIDAVNEPISVRHELKTLRRPLAASATDDGTTLAVLSSKHQANVYHLTSEGVKHVQVLVMDNPPRTISIAPEGTVLAAAYDGGVEVFSLAPSALSTDRRAVRSEGVDSLSFSGDGSMLVGSTQSLDEPSAVVITAPFYTENDLPPKEIHSRMWTTQILFPQISSICSHAELLQGHTEGDANWLFAYDHTLMSYRAVRTDDTRTGVAYFLNPSTNRRFSIPMPSTAPTSTACGTLVVAGFGEQGLWLYGIPEKLDVAPDMGSVVERHEERMQARARGQLSLTSATGHLEPLMAYSPSVSGSSEEIEDDSLAAKVEWRESLFVKCAQVRSIDGATAAKWVETPDDRPSAFAGKRLVIVAPGGVDQFAEDLGDEIMPMDGSRLAVLDFNYGPSAGQDDEVTIEVGDKEPELLMEQMGDMDIEVAMERRRTVRERNRGGMRAPIGRSVTTASATQSPRLLRSVSQTSSGVMDMDAQIAMASSPTKNGQPLPSPNSLHRSATAGGFASARFPARPPLAQQQDAANRLPAQLDGWESPPPPYSGGNSPNMRAGANQASQGYRQPPPSGLAGGGLGGIPEHGYAPALHPGFGHGFPVQYANRFTSVPQQNYPPSIPPAMPQQPATNKLGAPFGASASTNGLNGAPSPEMHPQRSTTGTSFAPTEESSRPVSREGGRVSPYQQTPASQKIQTPTERPSPLALSTSHPNSSNSASSQRLGTDAVTLTGANLQARLNHPVPPTPASMQRMSQMYENMPPAATQQPPTSHPASYTVPSPTTDQMAKLDKRMSQSRKPVGSGMTNGNSKTASRDFSGPSRTSPSPPPGAWGAAGVPGSPSFNKAIATPNGLMRSNSKGSNRSIPISASTPNLHAAAPVHASRPGMSRLDTIDSISSSYGPGEPSSRNHSVSVPMPTVPQSPMQQFPPQSQYPNQQPLSQHPYIQQHLQQNGYSPPPQQYTTQYQQMQQQIQQQYQQQMQYQQSHIPNGIVQSDSINGRRVLTDPNQLDIGRKKTKGRKSMRMQRSYTPEPSISGVASEPAGRKKKGSRCVVM
jgi:hypothetical protein